MEDGKSSVEEKQIMHNLLKEPQPVYAGLFCESCEIFVHREKKRDTKVLIHSIVNLSCKMRKGCDANGLSYMMGEEVEWKQERWEWGCSKRYDMALHRKGQRIREGGRK